MIITQNNNQIEVQATYCNRLDYYEISAYVDGHEAGHSSFKITNGKSAWAGPNAWLYHLATKDQFARCGVASAMLLVVEYICSLHYVSCIEGNFFPFNQFARPFYEKHNYSIVHETQGQLLVKYLDRGKVFEEAETKINGFEIKEEAEEQK